MKHFVIFISLILVMPFALASKQDKPFLGLELVCSQALKEIELKELCSNPKKCDWKIEAKSKSAYSWRKGKDIHVVEVRNRDALKVFLFDYKNFFEIKIPWCQALSKLNLPQNVRKLAPVLIKNKEVVYLLPEGDKVHLARLKSINHPCRKLKRIEFNKAYSFYFLEPQSLKGCQ